jgi:hypothetical protein
MTDPVVLSRLRAVADEHPDRVGDGAHQTPARLQEPECRQRDDRRAVRPARVHHDRAARDRPRKFGDVHDKIPVAMEQQCAGRVEHLRQRRRPGDQRVAHLRDLPAHVRVAAGEFAFQILPQPLGRRRLEDGRDHEAEFDGAHALRRGRIPRDGERHTASSRSPRRPFNRRT